MHIRTSRLWHMVRVMGYQTANLAKKISPPVQGATLEDGH